MCCTSTWTPQPLKVVGAAAESAAAGRVRTVPPRRGPWRGEPGEERMNRRSQRGVQRASEGASSLTVAAAAAAAATATATAVAVAVAGCQPSLSCVSSANSLSRVSSAFACVLGTGSRGEPLPLSGRRRTVDAASPSAHGRDGRRRLRTRLRCRAREDGRTTRRGALWRSQEGGSRSASLLLGAAVQPDSAAAV